MNIRTYFALLATFFVICLSAQEKNVFQIKHELYNYIIDDLKKQFAPTVDLEVWLDSQSIQFEEISFDEYGIKLLHPYWVDEQSFCENKIKIYCKEKIDLEMLEIPIIYQPNLEHLYPKYILIHQPIDAWYRLIYQLNKKKYLVDYDEAFELKIPIKQLEVKKQKQVETYLLYTLKLNKRFEIEKATKSNF